MIPTHLRERKFPLYVAAVCCGLIAGTALLFWQNIEPSSAITDACKAEPQVTNLQDRAKGDVAAFIQSPPRAVPDLEFSSSDNTPLKLSAFRGKTVLLNLWATWCVPCREEMPALNILQQQRGESRFEVVALSLDETVEKARGFYADYKIDSLKFYSDASGAAFRALRKMGLAAGLPTSLLIDEKGCLIGHLSGPADWAGNDALSLIDAALKR